MFIVEDDVDDVDDVDAVDVFWLCPARDVDEEGDAEGAERSMPFARAKVSILACIISSASDLFIYLVFFFSVFGCLTVQPGEFF